MKQRWPAAARGEGFSRRRCHPLLYDVLSDTANVIVLPHHNDVVRAATST